MNKKFTSEEVINSLEGMRRAEPNPFLYTRIMARMENENFGMGIAVYRLIARPIFAIAIAFLLIAFNGYLILNREQTHAASEDISQVVAMEYAQQNQSNPYDTNENP